MTHQTTLRMLDLTFYRTSDRITEGQIVHAMKEIPHKISKWSWCGIRFSKATHIFTRTVLIDIAKRPQHPPSLPSFKGPWIVLPVDEGRACDRCLRAIEKFKRRSD